jgi:hypothetical protein
VVGGCEEYHFCCLLFSDWGGPGAFRKLPPSFRTYHPADLLSAGSAEDVEKMLKLHASTETIESSSDTAERTPRQDHGRWFTPRHQKGQPGREGLATLLAGLTSAAFQGVRAAYKAQRLPRRVCCACLEGACEKKTRWHTPEPAHTHSRTHKLSSLRPNQIIESMKRCIFSICVCHPIDVTHRDELLKENIQTRLPPQRKY